MSPNYSTLFFDLFGVLIGTDQSALIHYLSKELNCPYHSCREIVTGEIFMRFERAEIDFEQYLIEVCDALPSGELLNLDEFRLRWHDHRIAELPLTGLLVQLADSHRIHVLSNTTNQHVEFLKTQFDFFQFVDGYTTSESAGVSKPSRGIFLQAMEDAGAEISQSIFIDDTRVHVRAAAALGFTAHHYIDFEKAVEFLNTSLELKLAY